MTDEHRSRDVHRPVVHSGSSHARELVLSLGALEDLRVDFAVAARGRMVFYGQVMMTVGRKPTAGRETGRSTNPGNCPTGSSGNAGGSRPTNASEAGGTPNGAFRSSPGPSAKCLQRSEGRRWRTVRPRAHAKCARVHGRATPGERWRTARCASHAGGHWFDPSHAHRRSPESLPPAQRRCRRRARCWERRAQVVDACGFLDPG